MREMARPGGSRCSAARGPIDLEGPTVVSSAKCDARRERMSHVLPSLVWGLLLIVWTVGLLTPDPVQIGKEALPPEAIFPLAKATHVAAYALLAALLVWVTARPRWRWALLAGLSLHGGLTEYLQ